MAEEQVSHERTAWVMVWLAVALALLAAWLAWLTTRSVARPLNRLDTGARDIADGQYHRRIAATGVQEVDQVGQALNAMAETVAQRETQTPARRLKPPSPACPTVRHCCAPNQPTAACTTHSSCLTSPG